MLIAALLMISAASIIVGNYYLYTNSEEALTNQVYDHLTTAAQSRAAHVRTYIEEEKQKVSIMADSAVIRNYLADLSNGNPVLDKDIQDVQKRLDGLVVMSVEYNEVFVLDTNGTIVASSNKVDIGTDKSEDAFFIYGRNGTYVKDAYISPVTGKPAIGVSSPIKDKQGNLAGVYVVRINMDALNEITSERSGLGETEEVLLFNTNRYMVTPSKYISNSVLSLQVNTSIVNKCFEDIDEYTNEGGDVETHEEEIMHYADYRKVDVVGAHAYIQPQMKWCLVTKIDEAEALGKPKSQMTNVLITTSIATLAFIILTAYLVSRLLTKQIKRLTSSVEAITKGDLDIQLAKSSISEVESLTESLNRILASMKLAILRTGMTKEQIGLGEAIKAKEEAESKYYELFNNSADSTFIHTLDGRFLEVNDSACRTLGYTRDEFMKLGPAKIDSPRFAKIVPARIAELQKNGSAVFESAHMAKDGREIPVEISSRVINYAGKPAILSAARDVSGRREAEARYKALYDSSADAIMTIEPPKWNFTAGNPATMKMFNVKDEQELASLNPSDLSPKYQPDGQLSSVKARKMMDTAMEKGSHFFEWTHKRYKGKDFPATVLLTKVKLGNREFLQATVRDITELRKA